MTPYKLLLVLLLIWQFPGLQTSGLSQGAAFAIPFATNQLLFPANFLLPNPALTNQVVIVHLNGKKVKYTAAVNTALGRGQALQNAMEDPSLAAGDVFFLCAGLFTTAGTTNQGLSQSPLDLTSYGNSASGSHIVGMGLGETIIDMGGANPFTGTYSSFRDLTITNSISIADHGSLSLTFATNQFAYFWNVAYYVPLPAVDLFIVSESIPNLWLEHDTFGFTYDVFASSVTPRTNVLVSHSCTYIGNGSNSVPIVRVQYGCMARTCYISGDNINCSGGTNFNIGVDNSDTGKTNATVYVWNTTVMVNGPGERSFSNGSRTNNATFIGSGCVYDASKATILDNYYGTYYGNDSGLTNVVISGPTNATPPADTTTIKAWANFTNSSGGVFKIPLYQ
jgi:hypothetical protein